MNGQAKKNIRQAFPVITFGSAEWEATQAAARWACCGLLLHPLGRDATGGTSSDHGPHCIPREEGRIAARRNQGGGQVQRHRGAFPAEAAEVGELGCGVETWRSGPRHVSIR